jgi:hypothetical protein
MVILALNASNVYAANSEFDTMWLRRSAAHSMSLFTNGTGSSSAIAGVAMKNRTMQWLAIWRVRIGRTKCELSQNRRPNRPRAAGSTWVVNDEDEARPHCFPNDFFYFGRCVSWPYTIDCRPDDTSQSCFESS